MSPGPDSRPGELIQAAGRLRGPRRTAANPAEIIVVNDVVLEGVPVDELFDANVFFTVTLDDRMFAAGGIAFDVAADAFRAYPDLWPSAEAAKKALRRAGGAGHSPMRTSIIGKCPAPLVTYRKNGAGQRTAQCRVDASVGDPKTKLERMLGPLAFFMMITSDDKPADDSHEATSVPASQDLNLYRKRQKASAHCDAAGSPVFDWIENAFIIGGRRHVVTASTNISLEKHINTPSEHLSEL